MVTTGSLFGVHQVVSAWGVPMSTDVALVSALLALVAPSRSGLRITMLAIAIADDALGITVLAFSHHVEWRVGFLVAGAVGLYLTHLAARQHLRRISMAASLAAAVLLIHGGLSPTLTFVAAGVALTSLGAGLDNMQRVCAHLSTWIALPLFGLVVGTINWPTHLLRGNLSVCLWLFSIRLLGKASGLLLGVWCARRVNWHLPVRLVRRDLIALSILAAMGVTVPLYFAESAFPVTSPTYSAVDLTLLATTIVSAVLGAMMLRRSNYDPSPVGQLTPVPPSPQ
jgi:NhaA family Na+:H+ antiporter